MLLRTASALVLGCAFALGASAQAQDKLTAQQQRMKTCNVQAGNKELKGDERKAFMSRCLKGDKVANSQQDRMASCNADAKRKELKGDQRQSFMRECLSSDAGRGSTKR